MIYYIIAVLINNVPSIILAYFTGYCCSNNVDGWGWLLIGSILTASKSYIQATPSSNPQK